MKDSRIITAMVGLPQLNIVVSKFKHSFKNIQLQCSNTCNRFAIMDLAIASLLLMNLRLNEGAMSPDYAPCPSGYGRYHESSLRCLLTSIIPGFL